MAAYSIHPGKHGKVKSGWHKASYDKPTKRLRAIARADKANARFWNS